MIDLLKDSGPALGDVHSNKPAGAIPYLQTPGRTDEEVEAERRANLKPGDAGAVQKAEPKPLYVSRKVVNGAEIIAWAKKAGFKTTYPADELHVTIAASRSPVDWMECGQSYAGWDKNGNIEVPPGGPRMMELLGLKQDHAVLLFDCDDLGWRHDWLDECGCSWDWPTYQPHISISQNVEGLKIDQIEPYQGKIVLGPEIFAEFVDHADADIVEKSFSSFFKVSGVNEDLGLVFGWGIICKENGQPYFDVQKNHIPEDPMVQATTDFMRENRDMGQQHLRMGAGMVVHSFPLTAEIWKAMFSDPDTHEILPGLPPSPPRSGWMVAVAPDAQALKAFKAGELTGFSIGGEHVEIDGKPVEQVQ